MTQSHRNTYLHRRDRHDRRRVENVTKNVKNVTIFEFHYDIWIRHEKCLQISISVFCDQNKFSKRVNDCTGVHDHYNLIPDLHVCSGKRIGSSRDRLNSTRRKPRTSRGYLLLSLEHWNIYSTCGIILYLLKMSIITSPSCLSFHLSHQFAIPQQEVRKPSCDD